MNKLRLVLTLRLTFSSKCDKALNFAKGYLNQYTIVPKTLNDYFFSSYLESLATFPKELKSLLQRNEVLGPWPRNS